MMKMYIDLNSAVSEAPLAKKELNDLRWQLAEAQKALSECLAKQQEKPLGFQHWQDVFRVKLAEAQAGEAKLREALNQIKSFTSFVGTYIIAEDALALPTDDTALKEAIKQGQREALLKAAWVCEGYTRTDAAAGRLRLIAEEIK
jgi:hypothetical protein